MNTPNKVTVYQGAERVENLLKPGGDGYISVVTRLTLVSTGPDNHILFNSVEVVNDAEENL